MHTKLTTRLSHVSAWVESVRTNEALLKSVEKDYERMRRTVSFIDVFVLYELEPYLLTAGLCCRHVAEMCDMADKGCLVESVLTLRRTNLLMVFASSGSGLVFKVQTEERSAVTYDVTAIVFDYFLGFPHDCSIMIRSGPQNSPNNLAESGRKKLVCQVISLFFFCLKVLVHFDRV